MRHSNVNAPRSADLLTDLDLESDTEQKIDLDSILSCENIFEIMEFQGADCGGSSPDSKYCSAQYNRNRLIFVRFSHRERDKCALNRLFTIV